MTRTPRLIVIWLVAVLGSIGFVAGFNVVVDPFGYFGTNRIGYYFSSEREFKYSMVKSYDYNAIILGDSRIAFTDPAHIARPEFRFVNGGIGGSTIAEEVALLSASHLDRLKLVVLGLVYGDLTNCSRAAEPKSQAIFDPLRFAASWTQLAYSIDALIIHGQGRSPLYHPDGTRSISDKYFGEATFDAKTEDYWRAVKEGKLKDPPAEPHFEFSPKCRKLMSEVRSLAERHGFAFIVVFLPVNDDVLQQGRWDRPQVRAMIGKYLDEVRGVAPHVVDLSNGPFSDSRNFWLDDATHFKPVIGARVVEEAIDRSSGTEAGR